MKEKIRNILYTARTLFVIWAIDLKDLKIKEDIERWKCIYQFDFSDFKAISILLWTKPEFRNLILYRMQKKFIRCTWIKIVYPPMKSLYIEAEEIDGGLFIQHGFATMIAAKRIGKNCWINQQVTIGYKGNNEPPKIGDNVTITCGAKVLGDIVVGDGAIIGANAVVIRDVEPEAVMVGVPAHRIR